MDAVQRVPDPVVSRIRRLEHALECLDLVSERLNVHGSALRLGKILFEGMHQFSGFIDIYHGDRRFVLMKTLWHIRHPTRLSGRLMRCAGSQSLVADQEPRLRPRRFSISSTCRVVFSTTSGLRLIESMPISTRNCAISG